MAPGSATISATIAADSSYLSASAEFSLQAIDREYNFRGWLDKESSELFLPAAVDGMELYLSQDEECDIANYSACTQGSLFSLNTSVQTVETQSFNLNDIAYPELRWGNHKASGMMNAYPNYFGEAEIQVSFTYFNGRYWKLGGNRTGVYSSKDGINWRFEADVEQLAGRENVGLVEFNDFLWAFDGIDADDDSKARVLRTENGIDWEVVATDLPMMEGSYLVYSNALVHEDRLWLISASAGDHYIWSSEDGLAWVLENNDPGFYSNRIRVVEFKDKFWQFNRLSRAYFVSDDLKNWQRVEQDLEHLARSLEAVIVFKNQLIRLEGIHDSYQRTLPGLWISSDGLEWEFVELDFSFGKAGGVFAHIVDDELHLVGGSDDRNPASSDSDTIRWSTSDLINWQQHTSGVDYYERSLHQTVEFKGALVVVGGQQVSTHGGDPDRYALNDVWSSHNGLEWQALTIKAEFPARFDHVVKVIDDDIWVFGGRQSSPNVTWGEYPRSDIWRSSDGVTWSQVETDSMFKQCHTPEILSSGCPTMVSLGVI